MVEPTPLPLSPERATQIISKRAADSSKVTFRDDCSEGEWHERVTWLQALKCLEKGELIGGPDFNDETNCWECRMRRFAAGQDIVIDVVISNDQSELYVVNVCEK